MRLTLVIAVLLALAGHPPLRADQQPSQEELIKRLLGAAEPESAPDPERDDKILYSLGFNIWRPLTQLGLTPGEVESVLRGVRDAADGTGPMVELETYGPMIETFARARMAARVAEEKSRAEAFIAEQAARPGAIKTASGLVYFDLTPGAGASPTAADRVTVHYRGTLAAGTEFDSSYARGEPADFGLRSVIPCWTEGVARMQVGGTARLVCPSSIAYGDNGQAPDIPGGATLIFVIELLAVLP